jgi:predicted glycosyltransferase involved in capsule biosynthesis
MEKCMDELEYLEHLKEYMKQVSRLESDLSACTSERNKWMMKFLTLKAFVEQHFQEDCGICVHTWCRYHKQSHEDFCSAPELEDMVRENCYRTWEKER